MKCHENPFSSLLIVTRGQRDGRTDMAKLMGGILQLFVANVPKFYVQSWTGILVRYMLLSRLARLRRFIATGIWKAQEDCT
jgi:hypothetical protein